MKKEISFREIYNHDVRKVNAIATSAAFDYSLLEEKLVDYISTLVPTPKVNDKGEIKYPLVYVLYYSHFCKSMGKKGDSKYYKNIDQAIQNLRDKSIRLIMNDQKSTLISFLERVEFNKEPKKGESRKAIIKLDDRIIPILIEKKKNYFEYHPEYTMFMDSKFSIRFYQWFLAMLNKEISIKKSKTFFEKGILLKDVDITKLEPEKRQLYAKKIDAIAHAEREYSLSFDEIKEQLSISKNYRGYETVCDRIIFPAVQEINKKTDLCVNKDKIFIDENNYVHFSVKRKNTIELSILEGELMELVNSIIININEISHVMEDEDEYEVEQYALIEKWAETM